MLVIDALIPLVWLVREIWAEARQACLKVGLDRQEGILRNFAFLTFQVELHQVRKRQIFPDDADG
ncbi:hypothetical protein D9M69_729900 [compost metagenome]